MDIMTPKPKKSKLLVAIEFIEDICDFVFSIGMCISVLMLFVNMFAQQFCVEEFQASVGTATMWCWIITTIAFVVCNIREVLGLKYTRRL